MSFAHLHIKAWSVVCGLWGVIRSLVQSRLESERNSLEQNLEVHNRGLTVGQLLGRGERFIIMKEDTCVVSLVMTEMLGC